MAIAVNFGWPARLGLQAACGAMCASFPLAVISCQGNSYQGKKAAEHI
jgi:hypothetical protein